MSRAHQIAQSVTLNKRASGPGLQAGKVEVVRVGTAMMGRVSRSRNHEHTEAAGG